MKINKWKVASFLVMIAAGFIDQKVQATEVAEQIAEFFAKNK